MRNCALIICVIFSSAAFPIDWIAHRANSCEAPENTLRGIADSWRVGATAIELDVRFSADGVVFLFHDSKYKNRKLVELTYGEITGLIGKTRVPQLSNALTLDAQGYYILDLKQPKTENVQTLKKVLTASRVGLRSVIIQSDDPQILSELKKHLDGTALAYLTKLKRVGITKSPPKPADILQRVKHIEINALTIKGRRFLDADYIAGLKSTGLQVFVWTINNHARGRYYERIGVDGIITDSLTEFLGNKDECYERLATS